MSDECMVFDEYMGVSELLGARVRAPLSLRLCMAALIDNDVKYKYI